jgi:hypothetical protein
MAYFLQLFGNKKQEQKKPDTPKSTDLFLAAAHEAIGNPAAAVRYTAVALDFQHVPTPVEAQTIVAARSLEPVSAGTFAPAAPIEDEYDPSAVKEEPTAEGTFDQAPPLAQPRRSARMASKLGRANGKVATAFDQQEFERRYLQDMPTIDVDQLIREEVAGGGAEEEDSDSVQLFDEEEENVPVVKREVLEREVKSEPKRAELGDEEFEALVEAEPEEDIPDKDKGEAEPEDAEDVNDGGLEGDSADEVPTQQDLQFIADEDEPEVYVEGVDVEEEEELEIEEEEEDDKKPKKAFVIESSESDSETTKGSKPYRKR